MQDMLENNYEMGEMLEETVETRRGQGNRLSSFTRVVHMERADEGFQIGVQAANSWASLWDNWCEESAVATKLVWADRNREPVWERLAAAWQLHAVLKKYLYVSPDPHPTVSQETKSLFYHDLEEWRSDTRFSSNLAAQLSHPAYLRIIAMGHAVLPLILKDLQNGGGHWFVALRAITREDPVPPEHRSLPRSMLEDWLRWAAEKGLINDDMEFRSAPSCADRAGISSPQG